MGDYVKALPTFDTIEVNCKSKDGKHSRTDFLYPELNGRILPGEMSDSLTLGYDHPMF